MEEIIFPNQIRMYRRLRGRSMQELADHLSVSLSMSKTPSRKSFRLGGESRKEETKSTKKPA